MYSHLVDYFPEYDGNVYIYWVINISKTKISVDWT